MIEVIRKLRATFAPIRARRTPVRTVEPVSPLGNFAGEISSVEAAHDPITIGPSSIFERKRAEYSAINTHWPRSANVNAAVAYHNGVVLDAEGSRVDGPWLNNPIGVRLVDAPRCPIRRVSARVIVLATPFSRNYYHWMLEVLPAVALLVDSLQNDDVLYVDQSLEWQRETLSKLVPDSRQIICSTACPGVEGRSALLVERSDPFTSLPHWVVKVLQANFVAGRSKQASRRLYITRNDAPSRRVKNEAELVAALGELGFEVVAPSTLSVQEQIELFRDADCVVGPHGAGLTSSVFCRPGTLLVELSAPRYIFPCWAELAAKSGLKFAWIAAPGTDDEFDHGWKYQKEDYSVDVPAVLELLRSRL